jgi:hypothetical protein
VHPYGRGDDLLVDALADDVMHVNTDALAEDISDEHRAHEHVHSEESLARVGPRSDIPVPHAPVCLGDRR